MTASASAYPGLDGREVVWEAQPRQDVALRCPAFELCYGGTKGCGKLLPLDTPIPTPSGWKLNGELAVGDEVIGEDGRPVRILWLSDIETEDAYRLAFSDGTSIVAGANHLWKTMTAEERDLANRRRPEWRAARRAKRASRSKGKRPDVAAKNRRKTRDYLMPPVAAIRTTQDIFASLFVKRGVSVANHSIAQHAPIELPEVALPLAPYTLGAWLGDGCTGSGRLAGIDGGIFEQIEADGFRVSHHADKVSHCILGIPKLLRAAGVYGDKRIPRAYLRASVAQRVALLQGLMDTDGWCSKTGSCYIALCKEDLFRDVVELLRTLGIIVNVSKSMKTATNGKPGNRTACWTACFVTSIPAFRLERKLARQIRVPHERYSRRFIVDAEPVGPVRMRCIQVASSGGMFLAGEQFIPTHNSDVVVMAPIDQIMYAEQRYRETGRKQRGRFVIFRKQLKNLTDLITRALELYPLLDPNAGIDGWTKMDKRFTFRSGFVVEFAHLEGPDDHLGYNGQELSGFAIDQLEDIEQSVYLFLVMQVRSKDEGMRKLLRIVCTANPGGRHPGWVKSYFVEGCRPWNTIIKTEVPLSGGRKRVTTKAFIPAKLSDNKYLYDDGSYEANLMRLPEDMRRMYLDGDWDVVVGSFFGAIWSRNTHVIKSFPIPGSWPIKGGIDWGSTAPASCHFAAKDNDGNIYIIDEIYRPGITGRTFGEHIAKRFQNQRWSAEKKYSMDEVYFLIDRQARASMGGDGRYANAAAGISSWGVRLFDANKDRPSRAEQWLERLIPDAKTGKPRVFIFGDRCPNLVRILPQLPRDEHNPDDIDHDSECHAYDSSGFILMDWPLDTSVKPTAKTGDRDVERWLDLARKRQAANEAANDEWGIHAGYGD